MEIELEIINVFSVEVCEAARNNYIKNSMDVGLTWLKLHIEDCKDCKVIIISKTETLTTQ